MITVQCEVLVEENLGEFNKLATGGLSNFTVQILTMSHGINIDSKQTGICQSFPPPNICTIRYVSRKIFSQKLSYGTLCTGFDTSDSHNYDESRKSTKIIKIVNHGNLATFLFAYEIIHNIHKVM